MLTHFFRWLTMGGYSIYIWPAYSIVSVILVMHLLGIKCNRVKTHKRLLQWFKQQKK